MDKKLYLIVEGRMDVMSVVFFEISRDFDEELDTLTNELVSAVKLYEGTAGTAKKRDPRQILDLGGKLQKARTKAVVFAAMCLEAFIYDFASHYFDSEAKRLEKQPFIQKWTTIPKSALGKGLPEKAQAFEHLTRLWEERRDLVHAKSMSLPASTGTDGEFAEAILSEMEPKIKKRLERQETSPKPHKVVVEVLTALDEIEYADGGKDKWWELTECPPRLLRFMSEIGLGTCLAPNPLGPSNHESRESA